MPKSTNNSKETKEDIIEVQSNSNSRSISFYIFTIVFGLLASFLILEVGLRVYYSLSEKLVFGLEPSRSTLGYYENDHFGHALIPNQSGWFATESKEYATWVEVNSHGWPDIEHSFEKPIDIYRIVLLGDSFTENFQVELKDRFFRQVEQSLNEMGGIIIDTEMKKIEVIAVGRGNTGTAQQYLMLKEYGMKYNPDLVIQLFLTANDVKNNAPILQNDPHLPYYELIDNSLELVPQTKRSNESNAYFKSIAKSSRLIELGLKIRQQHNQLSTNQERDYPTEYHIYDPVYNSEYTYAWELTEKLLLNTKKLTEENKAKYLLVTLANNEQVNKDVWNELLETYPEMKSANLDPEKPDKLLNDFCVDHNVECHFMLPYFQKHISQNPQQTTHHRYDGHWNEIGTNLAVEFLSDVILKTNQ